MKKRIKEWVLGHETLYWVVVAVFAVLVFGIVTAVGCAKVYEANAAETSDGVYYPSMKEIDCGEYLDLISKNLEVCPYVVILSDFSDEGNIRYEFALSKSLIVCTRETTEFTFSCDAVFRVVDNGNGFFVYEASEYVVTKRTDCVDNEDILVGSNCFYEVRSFQTGDESIVSAIRSLPQNNLVHPKDYIETLYSTEAPYITFDRLAVRNLIADGETSKLAPFQNMYEDYTKLSTWTYYGTLNNRDSTDLEYLLEATFVVEMPTLGYVQDLAYELGVDMEWEHSMLSNAPGMVYHWNNDNKATKYTYEFQYAIPITPDADGRFSYQFTFDTIETAIMYFNEEARERIYGYSDYWRSILLSYLHVDSVTVSVKTTRSDSIVYGKVTTNQFDRGIYDVCIEVIPDIDINTATPEEIDKIIEDSLQDAHDKYLADLEQRLEDLEGQLNDVGSIDGAFSGSLEGTGLWSGFKSLAGGLASLGGTVSGISSAIGSVFGFLPVDIQYVMGYTILALCVIALVKAIRG